MNRIAWLFFAILVLVACGDSGGDDGEESGPPTNECEIAQDCETASCACPDGTTADIQFCVADSIDGNYCINADNCADDDFLNPCL